MDAQRACSSQFVTGQSLRHCIRVDTAPRDTSRKVEQKASCIPAAACAELGLIGQTLQHEFNAAGSEPIPIFVMTERMQLR
eukprot:6196543-Pleurochrysis_carterae.AAC.3